MEKQDLLNRVLDQIALDIENQDFTAIEELIKVVPEENLVAFLSEINE